jgi:uncharacterized protein with beta-barrel porin domain
MELRLRFYFFFAGQASGRYLLKAGLCPGGRSMFHRLIAGILAILMPLGVMFPTFAAAQTALGNSSDPYVLNALAGTSFSVAPGVAIEIPMGHAISGSDEDWTLVNLGSIRSQEFGNAIEIQGGASAITNGSAETAGSIAAFHNGINVNGDLTAFNLGASTIQGGDNGIIVDAGGLTLVNQGTISGVNQESELSSGVYVWGGGGTIVNGQGATIQGMDWGATYSDTLGAQGDIENHGILYATRGIAVNTDRGTITNYGTGEITGGHDGVQIGTGTFVNMGMVIANGRYEDGVLQAGNGVRLNGEGTIDNRPGGSIYGVGNGIAIDWMATVVNAGTIGATAATGNGILFADGGEGKIINSGSISGGEDGYAILSLSDYSSELVLLPGSNIVGPVEMGAGDGDRLTFGGTAAASAGRLEDYRNFEVGTVESGADWTLDGVLGITEFTNNGTLQAGTDGKPFAIAGKYVQTDAGTLQVVRLPDGTSSTLVALDAELAGMVYVAAGSGGWRQDTTYTILEADRLAGQFTGSATDLAFLTPILDADQTSVTLTLARNGVELGDVAATESQAAVALALAGSSNDALLQAVESQTAEGARAAFDALAGDIYGDLGGQAIGQAGQLGVVMLDRARAPLGAAPGNQPLAPAGYVAESMSAASAAALRLATGQPNGPHSQLWSQIYGGIGNMGGGGSALPGDWVNGGLAAGIDISDEAWRIGMGGSLGKGFVNRGTGTAEIDSYTALVYASHDAGRLGLRGGATFGLNGISTQRQVVFPGFAEQLSASYGGSSAQVFGEVGIELPLDQNASLEPYVGLSYGHFATDAAQETGGTAALHVAAADLAWLTATVGIRASATLSLSDTMDLTPRLGVAWQSNSASAQTSTGAFAGGPSFTVTGANLPSGLLLVDMGVDLGRPNSFVLSFNYNGAFSKASASHQLGLSMGKAL